VEPQASPSLPRAESRTGTAYPPCPASCPNLSLTSSSYLARFARDARDLEAIQRLRFEVFNRELGEGLDESWKTGLDQDRFDAHCHHLIVEHAQSGEVVGTYRLQTWEMAQAGEGFYTAAEFDLSALPEAMFERSVETGRACVAKEHRNGRVITLLWKGLASYLVHNKKTVLFGCCSLTSQDPHVARQTFDFLSRGGFVHPTWRTQPLAAYASYASDFVPELDVTVKLPALFAAYLKLGALVSGEPALDREFKTIDFLALLDTDQLEASVRHSFFRHIESPAEGSAG